MQKTQLSRLGWEWNWRSQEFVIPRADGSHICLTPPELIQLGLLLILEGTKLMDGQPCKMKDEQRWH
jgi:hypothetical protein